MSHRLGMAKQPDLCNSRKARRLSATVGMTFLLSMVKHSEYWRSSWLRSAALMPTHDDPAGAGLMIDGDEHSSQDEKQRAHVPELSAERQHLFEKDENRNRGDPKQIHHPT